MGAWRPKHVEWLRRIKTCTVLHQVGVLFDLYYDARKHKIRICYAYLFLSLVMCMSARMWNGLRCWMPLDDGGTTASKIYTLPGWSWDDVDDVEEDGRTGRSGRGAMPFMDDAWPVAEEGWRWQHGPEATLPTLFWRSMITVSPDEFMDTEEFERESGPPPPTLESHIGASMALPLRWQCCCLGTRQFILLPQWW